MRLFKRVPRPRDIDPGLFARLWLGILHAGPSLTGRTDPRADVLPFTPRAPRQTCPGKPGPGPEVA